jgi:hypothetical protein
MPVNIVLVSPSPRETFPPPSLRYRAIHSLDGDWSAFFNYHLSMTELASGIAYHLLRPVKVPFEVKVFNAEPRHFHYFHVPFPFAGSRFIKFHFRPGHYGPISRVS